MSDHFNGKIFFNHGEYKQNTFWDLIKWRFTKNPGPWPKEPLAQSTPPPVLLKEGQVKVTYVNHATVLIQSNDVAILTDPIWSERASPFSWIGPKRIQPPGIDFTALPKIDAVLISHNHYDHLDIPTLKKLQQTSSPLFIVPLGNKKLLEKNGITNVKEVDWWNEIDIKNTKITFLPVKHWSARWLNDKYRTLWGGYGILMDNKKIYFAGDTGYGNHFNETQSRWGKPDLACLPIGAYEPRWFMKYNHITPDEAVQAHLDLGAKQTLGIHFGFWQLGDDGFEQPVNDLNNAIEKYRLEKDTVTTLKPGYSVIL